jgi:uncharacterized HAD superfamily protein
MRIYVDIDDVLSETARALCGLAAREFDRHVAYEDVDGFNLQDVFHLTDEEMARFVKLSHARECIGGYEEVPGAVAGVKALREAGHRVELVTGRPAFSAAATSAWLEAVGLSNEDVTYVDKYNRHFEGGENLPRTLTMEELAARKYDLVIDDSPVVLARLAAWSWAKVFIFSRPWNVQMASAANMTRVRSWAEILERIDV